MLKKIVIIGPESTGKSTLSESLAQHYDTLWCPEFAREYLLKHGMNYSFEDLLIIAKGQIALEDEFVEVVAKGRLPVDNRSRKLSGAIGNALRVKMSSQYKNPHELLFIDTDMYVMKVWCEFVFGKCHQWIIDQIVQRKYDLYLLCNIDLSWTKDELREYPDPETRRKLYHIYKDIMINQTVPWVGISGNYEERLARSVEAVNQILSS
jgi:nicotinamide riboside kinase